MWSAPPPVQVGLVQLKHGCETITTAARDTIAARSVSPRWRAMPSFDVVSEVDAHEVANAVDQANRELTQRFDFKDSGARFELEALVVTLQAQVEFQLKQMLEILKLRLAKRGVDLACLEAKDPVTTLSSARQEVQLKQGIDAETGKQVMRLLKDSKLKVQGSLQGEKVRVTGKQRDDLQAAIALLRGAKVPVPLQFNNFRD
jgi:uncharacterized protein YajQ (UPF0234 family)